jgi:hypothetical protein
MDGISLVHHNLSHYLDELKEKLSLSHDEIYHNVASDNFSAINFLTIAQNLNVHPLKLWNQSVDVKALKANKQNKVWLLDKYSGYAGSHVASIKNVLQQFSKYGLYEDALSYLQISNITLNALEHISILAISDLLNFSKNFFVKDDYEEIGRRSARIFLNSNYGDKILNTQNPINLIDKAIAHMSLVERNWTYSIHSLCDHFLEIKTSTSEPMLNDTFFESYTNQMTTLVRFNFFKEAFLHCGIEVTSIEPVTLVNQWDSEFIFRIYFKIDPKRRVDSFYCLKFLN